MTKKQKPKERKAAILQAAMQHAHVVGYGGITREGVANAASCSAALISTYWGTMPQLKRAVMRHAIVTRDLRIILQGLAANDKQAAKAPDDLRRAAVQFIAN